MLTTNHKTLVKMAEAKLAKTAAKKIAFELIETIAKKTTSVGSVFGIVADIELAGGRYINVLYAYRCIKLNTDWEFGGKRVTDTGALADSSFFSVYQMDIARRATNRTIVDIQNTIKNICGCEEE